MKQSKARPFRKGRAAVIAAALLLALSAGFIPARAEEAPAAAEEPAVTEGPAVTEEPAAMETPAPETAAADGYFPDTGEYFRPEEPLTRREAVEILARAGMDAPMDGEEDDALTETALEKMIAAASDPATAAEALCSIQYRGDGIVTRAEAAVFFNRYFGLEPAQEERVYFPDVSPAYWAWGDIQTAASGGGFEYRPEPGFLSTDGDLYYVDEEGYFLKNAFVGSLLFSADGRYTSGSTELDGYVREVLRKVTDDTMTRDDKLYQAYLYVRDNFTYLRRNYYRTGDVGWQLQEALTMYSTGQGNCYCYASAFWAAARQLGYDAKIVSGTYGPTRAPHGWVEMMRDGARYTYDVEIEMVSLLPKHRWQNMFAMDDRVRMGHSYVESVATDNMVSRETNAGLLPG